ncbi:cation transporter [uncultured Senegalimassilia sp.]|uniref:cation transporter n=1 Tax=uncultured Senegalimassilia sp. TaxID=1714350 RepID=UPI0025F7BD5F|nr:cation transporter [uncultured Senegalimassilia sp.]
MRKTFKLDELDCANCGAKIEAEIKKIDGVNDAKVTFMTQKLMIDADDARFEQIVDEAQIAAHKYEPDCDIVR